MALIALNDYSFRLRCDSYVDDYDLVDDRGSAVGTGVGSPELEVASPLVGPGSAKGDGTDDRWSFGNLAVANMSTVDFCLAMRVIIGAGTGEDWLFNKRTGGKGWYLFVTSAGKLKFAINTGSESGSTTTDTTVRGAGAFSVFVSCVRGVSSQIYLGGVADGSPGVPSAGDIDSTSVLLLGGKLVSNFTPGTFDEAAIAQGYTSDDAQADAEYLHTGGPDGTYLSLGTDYGGAPPSGGIFVVPANYMIPFPIGS